LFSESEHLIIGTLHGGNTTTDCANFAARYSLYGKLWDNWDQHLIPELHMDKYLDPDNICVTRKLQGSYYTTNAPCTVTFSVKNGADNSSITDAKVTLDGIANPEGDYTFSDIVAPRFYYYSVYKRGYTAVTGRISILGDTNEEVTITSLGYSGEGSAESPYLIQDRNDLVMLEDFLGTVNSEAHFRIEADIDMGSENWTPIGSIDNPFCGQLHGAGHKITNLQITGTTPASGTGYYGLFGALGSGAVIEDLHITSGKIEIASGAGNANVGSIAGYVGATVAGKTVVIRNCSNSIDIINYALGTGNHTGGIVGSVSATSVMNIITCANTGNISGNSSRGGGIVGSATVMSAAASVLLSNCYSHANIISDRLTADGFLGGIIGCPYQNNAGYGPIKIDKCYAKGYIKVHPSNSTARLGGIAGRVYDSVEADNPIVISNSVAAQDSILGNSATAHRIYATHTSDGANTLSNLYAYEDMLLKGAKETGTLAANTNRGLDKTLVELQAQSTYAGISWDFTDVWAILEGVSFPYLQYQSALVVGIDKINSSATAVQIYPNPVSDLLNVRVDALSGPVTIAIFSITGKRYFTQTYTSLSEEVINVSGLPQGMYLVKVNEKVTKILKK
jgi:hypothetical protein